MVFRLGRFLARSTTTTRVPISGPSTVMSEKMPAVCIPLRGWDFVLVAILSAAVVRRTRPSQDMRPKAVARDLFTRSLALLFWPPIDVRIDRPSEAARFRLIEREKNKR